MEVELRAKISNIKVTRVKLEKLGAQFISQKKIVDYYFGELSLYRKIKHSFWIRVRVKDDDDIEIAYKGPTQNDGIYEEYEQKVQDLQTTLNILVKSGLENPITISKLRTKYKLGDVSVELDEIQDRGTYIELEKISEDTNREDLYIIFEKLGIPKNQVFEKGFITMFLLEDKSPYSKWVVN